MRLQPSAREAWGFGRDPFDDDPRDFTELFWSQAHTQLRDYIVSVIQRNGALAVSAPVGWGKSFLWMAVEDLLNHDPRTGYMVVRARSIEKRAICANMIQRAIIRDLDSEVRFPHNSEALSDQCEHILRARFERNKRIVLIIDEAHHLAEDAFRAIKNLLDIRSGLQRVMSIILLGQEELAPILRQHRLREVGARIEILTPGALSPGNGEVRAYIRWRIGLARFDRCPSPMELEALEIPFDETGLAQVETELSGAGVEGSHPTGVRPDLLAINAVCSHSLAYAAECGLEVVNEDVVRQARAKMIQGV